MTATRASVTVKRFGQSALLTPANGITIARIAVAVPTLVYLYGTPTGHVSSWLSVGLWFAITTSDSLDGWVARRYGATRSGAFLDPVADKLIVLGGLFILANRGDIWWWPVVVIAAREFGISVYRSVAGGRGIVIPAVQLGKYKAFVQYGAVGFVLLPWTASQVVLQRVTLLIATGLTLISGLQILRRGYSDWQRAET